ncbi:restriction endonuclease [Thermococcus sp. GR7]|uniref:type I restriction enzyme HsdR N-terminal domain-containing protein n=1 Tax=unclassified Thermococcus TaxID=2627626 RepID=UPI001431D62D|nr:MULTISPECIES: type I restriction enzyme HsdR N-terminal domain-containing protein [unclassified Thermococcus]NJE47245.1 restriction endonuclease [Thermococcus sp. GR7]NJE79038.1 restriction endonuclease [Thermococcus sp. GR4]NJF22648.1 restriction endonuclease [Thermococcus sp. GR5]
MDELRRAVLNVIRKIRSHRELYVKNEEAVKQHLIGEIFQALGWDWNNPEEVRPEERTEEGRADYALILNGGVFAYVEAKNLGVNILKREEPLRQLARYCFNSGVRYGILTNGAMWIAVKAFEEGSRLRDRVLLTVNVEEEPVEKAVLKLSILSKSRIDDIERLSSLLRAMELSFIGLKREGYPEKMLIEYLTSKEGSNTVPVEDLTGDETPKAAYVYDSGWKLLPLPEKSIKGVLLAVLLYMERRAQGYQREEIRKAYEHLRTMPLNPKTALEILRKLEEEEKLRISVEL